MLSYESRATPTSCDPLICRERGNSCFRCFRHSGTVAYLDSEHVSVGWFYAEQSALVTQRLALGTKAS
jgi:hypothetical protein